MRHNRFGRCSGQFGLVTAALLCALLVGCSAKSVPGGKPGYGVAYDQDMLTYIEDFRRFPQDLRVYAKNAALPPDLGARQAEAAQGYHSRFFQPWSLNKSSVPVNDAAWAERGYSASIGYDRSGKPIAMATRQAVSANAQFHLYPSLAQHGITVRNTLMRGMPTDEPFYHSPDQPGEGYPFDNYQMTALWVGTPVFISHASADKEWLFCETAFSSGWVRAEHVALAGKSFQKEWRAAELYAVTREDMGLSQGEAASGATPDLRVGALLPVAHGQVLIPQRTSSGQAAVTRESFPGDGLKPFPVKFTADAVAEIGNQLMDRPYGWGGSFFERDCSQMLRDLFTPFGIWLPRNSRPQLSAGFKSDISMLPPEAKAQWLKENAQPFRTLLGMPGHVSLYLGEYKGESAIFHAIWGLRTLTPQGEGRAVLGKACVTSLTPGAELHNIIKDKMLLNRFTGTATVLSKDGS